MMPFRPRIYGNFNTILGGNNKGGWLETEEEYEAIKDEALGGAGYGAMVQMQTSEGQEAYAKSLLTSGRGASRALNTNVAHKSGAIRRAIPKFSRTRSS